MLALALVLVAVVVVAAAAAAAGGGGGVVVVVVVVNLAGCQPKIKKANRVCTELLTPLD